MKSYSIGRDAGCDIVMNDNTDVVSRRHAVLTVASSGKMTITDLSTNGTYINGQRISSNVAVPVSRKDSVSFAHVNTLDWNMIPKTNQWLTYLIIGLVVCAVGAACAIFIPRIINGGGGDIVNPTVVDTLACTITFDANGGQGTMEPQRVNKGQKFGLVGNEFNREGYTFKGWGLKAEGDEVDYEDRGTVTIDKNVTLYAKWEQKTHKVTFNPNNKKGQKVDNPMEDFVVNEGVDTQLPLCVYKSKGYKFIGWKTKDGTAYKDGDIVNLKEDIKLFAQWEKNGSGNGGNSVTGNDDGSSDGGGVDDGNTGDNNDVKPIL